MSSILVIRMERDESLTMREIAEMSGIEFPAADMAGVMPWYSDRFASGPRRSPSSSSSG